MPGASSSLTGESHFRPRAVSSLFRMTADETMNAEATASPEVGNPFLPRRSLLRSTSVHYIRSNLVIALFAQEGPHQMRAFDTAAVE